MENTASVPNMYRFIFPYCNTQTIQQPHCVDTVSYPVDAYERRLTGSMCMLHALGGVERLSSHRIEYLRGSGDQ